MAKVNELMEGRNQGMVLALKIAKEQGIEALEKEIQYRNITGVSMKLTKAEMNAATTRMKIHSTKMAIAISLITLVDEFGMGKMQARKFKETFDRRVDEICDDGDITELLERIRNELDWEITFD